MSEANRRKFLLGAVSLFAAPAIVPFNSLMPVKLFEPECLFKPLACPSCFIDIDKFYQALVQATGIPERYLRGPHNFVVEPFIPEFLR